MKNIFSKHLNDTILSIELINDGFLSQGFKLNGEKSNYFSRKIKNVGGFEYIGDDLRSFHISHYMYENSENTIKSYGIVNIHNEYYHIQGFQEGELFSDKLYSKENIEKIATHIGKIHHQGKQITKNYRQDYKTRLYQRGFREIITNHETLFSLYENYIIHHEDQDFFSTIIHSMLDMYMSYTQQADVNRLTTLHGDFHDGNIYLDTSNKVHFFDYSRIPYGDPGIDIGNYIANLEIKSILDPSIASFKNIFLKQYISITGDKEIEKTTGLSKMRVGFIILSPLVQQYLKRDKKQKDLIKDYISNIS